MTQKIDVLIDVQAVDGKAGGVPNVARNIVAALLKRNDGLAYHIAGREDTLSGFMPSGGQAEYSAWMRKNTNTAIRVLSQHFLDGYRVNRIAPRIYFAPATLIPFGISSSTAKVSLIHDLAPFRVKGIYTYQRETYHKWMMRSVAARADHLVAISEATKNDIIDFLKVAERKVTVIPNATDCEIYERVPAEVKENRAKLKLTGRFILFVGKIQPRKNLVRLINAFGILGIMSSFKDVRLVIVGGKGWLDQEIRKAYEECRLKGRIEFLGQVPNDQLIWYYRCAEVFCFPSLYEGFGLPILEAMANGAPVATSNIGAMSEVLGNAGVAFNPYDTEEMANVLSKLLENEKLRDECVWNGYKRVQEFSWLLSAAKYSDLWKRLG
jgi:glycosyltransferase involved in cell wall biosynthesis